MMEDEKATVRLVVYRGQPQIGEKQKICHDESLYFERLLLRSMIAPAWCGSTNLRNNRLQ